MDSKYILKTHYKSNSEQIIEQYYDSQTCSLYVITRSSDGRFTLYNHGMVKKVATSKDLDSLKDKIPEY